MRKPWSTIRELIAAQAHARPEAAAILAPERSALTFGGLSKHVQQTGERLRGLGIQRGDKVASVLPNGPNAATGLLAVSTVATFVPLNPEGRKPEYDSLFLELTPRVLLVPAGAADRHPAALAARSLRIPVIDVVPKKPAGVFALEGRSGFAPVSDRPPGADDFAYIITTSGTTSRPKLVPMPHRAVCAAQAIIEDSMALSPADRCLNFTPLFHSLGLISGLVSTLGAGGSVVCLPGFQAAQFFDQLAEFEATWFAAVPAMLQSILENAPAHREKLARSRLRLIRSGGAALAPEMVERLERELGAPVLQVYGMSEAPCIASDRFAGAKKRGSVGRALHDDVQIVDENARPVPPGAAGEIIVRGPWVIPGYYRNQAASTSAFENGWFHTGDSGYFDADGFLFLTGRRKEFINRGGEKTSPVEVDEVLLMHPAVAEAVTFAVPDSRLGEEIAAAVVLRSGNTVTEAALQEFAASHLNVAKVPRKIVFVKHLPKGPSGKLSRFRMAAELGLNGSGGPACAAAPPIASWSEATSWPDAQAKVEKKLAAIFARVLRLPTVNPHDNFFDLGGDSLTAMQCVSEIQRAFGCPPLSPALFLWAPTVAQVASAILNPAEVADPAQVLPLQPCGSGLPFFLVSPGLEARALARRLGPDRPLFGVRVPNLERMPRPHTIERMAADCVRALRRFRPAGPYALGGWCSAAIIALEIARQLEEAGECVVLVALLDARGVLLPAMKPARRRWVRAVRLTGKLWFQLSRPGRLRRIKAGIAARATHVPEMVRRTGSGQPRGHAAAENAALRQYRPHPLATGRGSGRILHLWASERPRGPFLDPAFEWGHLSPRGFEFHEVPGDHFSMLHEPNVSEVARILARELDRVPVMANR